MDLTADLTLAEQRAEIAALDAEINARKRDEIARYPHGYGWHKTVGGGLPSDWNDVELTHLRPHDWTQARRIRFVRRSHPRPRVRRPRVRPREHRPRAPRRSGASSTTSGSDPGDDSPGEPPGSCRGPA